MKKNSLMVLLACTLFILSIPFGAVAQTASEAPLKVISTIYPPYDFVRQIAGDHVELSMLLSPGSESHSFEPSPRDIIKIQECDVFIYIGGETDAWVDRILESMDTSDMTILSLLDMVEAVPEEIVEGMEHDHDHDEEEAHDDHEDHEHEEEDHDHEHDHDAELDEHVWTSPRNAMAIVEALTDTLSTLDPAHAEPYAANTAAYLGELEALDAAFVDATTGTTRSTIVFGDRFPFRYLADAYGLDYYAAFAGCATDTQASVSTIAFLIDKVQAEQIPVVFHIEFCDGAIADTICESTGAKKLEMHSVHNVSQSDFENGVGYLELMYRNVDQLKEALR